MNPFESQMNAKHMKSMMNNKVKSSTLKTKKSKAPAPHKNATRSSSLSNPKHKISNKKQKASTPKKLSTNKNQNKVITDSADAGYTESDIKAMKSKYSTDRLNLHILTNLKRFQHMTQDKSRSKLLKRLMDIAYPVIMNSKDKEQEYKNSGKLAITNLKFHHKI